MRRKAEDAVCTANRALDQYVEMIDRTTERTGGDSHFLCLRQTRKQPVEASLVLLFVSFFAWIFRVAFRPEDMLQTRLGFFGKSPRHLAPGQLVPFGPIEQKGVST